MMNAYNAALTPEQKLWAYNSWCDGFGVTQIATALYVNDKTIWRALRNKPRIRKVLIVPEAIQDEKFRQREAKYCDVR